MFETYSVAFTTSMLQRHSTTPWNAVELPFLTISQWSCAIHPHTGIVYWATANLDYFTVTMCHSSPYRHCLLGNCHSWLFHSDHVPSIPIQALFTGQLSFLTISQWPCAIHPHTGIVYLATAILDYFTSVLGHSSPAIIVYYGTAFLGCFIVFVANTQIIHSILFPFHVEAIV